MVVCLTLDLVNSAFGLVHFAYLLVQAIDFDF